MQVLGWTQLAWCVLVLLLWTVAIATLPFDPDYTAGELLDHLHGWIETGLLYPPLGEGPTLRVLNYPPLVLMAMRAVVEWGVSPLIAGRVVNTVGLVALTTAVGIWGHARGGRAGQLAGTVGLLGASFGIVYGAGQVHIELWAVALTVAGYAVLAHGTSRRAAVGAGLLLAVACFAKQTQVIPACVGLIWAWRSVPAQARLASASFVAAGVFGAGAVSLAWGLEPWRHMVVYTVGTYSLTNLALQILSHIVPWTPLLAFVAHSMWRTRATAVTDLVVWYWVGAACWSFASVRDGSGYAYFLDLQVATVLWAGPRLFGGHRRRGLGWLFVAQVVGADIGAAAAAAVPLAAKWNSASDLAAICARFPAVGPVVTEEAGFARACGRQIVLHPFIMTSLATRGYWNPAPFEDDLQSGRFGAAILPFSPHEPKTVQRDRWTEGALKAFAVAPRSTPLAGGFWLVQW